MKVSGQTVSAVDVVAIEQGVRAGAGGLWQRLGWFAAGNCREIGVDHFDPARVVIAEYLKHTGRPDEAMQVLAVGCNEPAPVALFNMTTLAAGMAG